MVAPFYRTPAGPLIANDQALPPASNRQTSIDPNGLAARLHKHEQFISKLVDDHHDLIVYLPPMYEADGDRRFPSLYMQDGQNLFDPETSFIKGNYWRLGETADALIKDGAIEPLIIVGIYNSGVKRIDEYTPVEDKRLGGGQADAYGRMLVEELKPFIEGQYRTLPGAENCGMGGSSLGGLVTLYLGLQYPDGVFQAGGDVSLGVVAQPDDPQDSRSAGEEARVTYLAGYRHQRIDSGGTGCAVAARWADQKRMAAGRGPGLLRSGGWGAHGIRVGSARRSDVAVLVSGAATKRLRAGRVSRLLHPDVGRSIFHFLGAKHAESIRTPDRIAGGRDHDDAALSPF